MSQTSLDKINDEINHCFFLKIHPKIISPDIKIILTVIF